MCGNPLSSALIAGCTVLKNGSYEIRGRNVPDESKSSLTVFCGYVFMVLAALDAFGVSGFRCSGYQ